MPRRTSPISSRRRRRRPSRSTASRFSSSPLTVAPSTYHADDGAAYERFLGRWTQRLAEPFIAFARLPANGDVLDVGCGTGSLAMALERDRRGGRVVGV